MKTIVVVLIVGCLCSWFAMDFYSSVIRPVRNIRRIREERLKHPELNWPIGGMK